ncbi:MAG: hypothetical protein M3Z02_01525 [Actinomycetota bacterium]|nr:hypothetical protein [Actinomycetota bacterium]
MRALTVCLGVLGLVGAGSGCAAVTRGFSQRELVVVFQPGATRADHARIREACKDLPGVVAEPLTTSTLPATIRNEVRFDISKSSDRQRAALYTCLQRDPSYLGADEPNQQ